MKNLLVLFSLFLFLPSILNANGSLTYFKSQKINGIINQMSAKDDMFKGRGKHLLIQSNIDLDKLGEMAEILVQESSEFPVLLIKSKALKAEVKDDLVILSLI
ncbi:hypothetical protein N9N67_06850 [Bacteriovoracaceae bacterium]|nr:hypothetical protein [Bacteriovoracaceae bacterium]